MAAKVSTVISSGGARNRRGQTTPDPRPDASAGWTSMSWCRRAATPTGRAWERSVWREARVLIAECPAPHLPASMESALRAVAASVARDRGWQGMGTVAFSLDDRSGVFRVLCAQATLPGAAVADCEPVAAHALELRIDGGGDRHAPCTRLLVCGVTRGDALRRAYRALSEMPGPVAVDRGS